jgi:hypothetical protein
MPTYRIQISFGRDGPRLFEQELIAPVEDIERATDAAMLAFSAAFNGELRKARRAHAQRAAQPSPNHGHSRKEIERTRGNGYETTYKLRAG